MDLKATVVVGTDWSAAAGITWRLGEGQVRHLEVKDLRIQEKVRSHELRIQRVKSEDSRVDLLTMFLKPERHHKLIKLLPLSVQGTNRAWVGKLSGVGRGEGGEGGEVNFSGKTSRVLRGL